MSNTDNEIKEYLKAILNYIGDDSEREGLRDTPDRILKSWKELFSGYNQNLQDILKTFKDGACNEMVILKNIEFTSFCEHHFLPFSGFCSIGYIPDGQVIGISKLARLVDMYAKRLQIQERMTKQIASALMNILNPLGCMVIIEATHLCMVCRGIKKQNGVMRTNAIRGNFKENIVRQEFLHSI